MRCWPSSSPVLGRRLNSLLALDLLRLARAGLSPAIGAAAGASPSIDQKRHPFTAFPPITAMPAEEGLLKSLSCPRRGRRFAFLACLHRADVRRLLVVRH